MSGWYKDRNGNLCLFPPEGPELVIDPATKKPITSRGQRASAHLIEDLANKTFEVKWVDGEIRVTEVTNNDEIADS